MIQYEAEQNVPFPISELVWDYSLIGAGETGEQYAMIVAAKNESVSAVTDCVTRAGFEPRVVDVAPMALYNCAMWNYPDLEGCSLIVDIGARSTNLVYVERGRFFSRTVPIAGNAITQDIAKTFQIPFKEAEELKREVAFVALGGNYAPAEDEETDQVSKIVRTVVTRLHAEINRSTNFYKSQQGGSAPARVFLTGGSSVIPHLDTFFREKLQVDVEYFNPFQRVEVGPGVDTQKLSTDAFVLADVAGLAVRQAGACEILINLIPQAILRRQTFEKKVPALAAAAVGVAAILMILGVHARFEADQFKRQAAEEVQPRLDALRNAQKSLSEANTALAKTRADADAYLALIAQRARWVNILASLQEALPPPPDIVDETTGRSLKNSVWLTSIEPVTGPGGRVDKIRVTGNAWDDDMTLVEKFQSQQTGRPVTALDLLVERVKAQTGAFASVENPEQEMKPDLRSFRLSISLLP